MPRNEVYRIALKRVLIKPSANCVEVSWDMGKAEHRYFVVAVCKFKLMVITGAWKWLLKRVFKD